MSLEEMGRKVLFMQLVQWHTAFKLCQTEEPFSNFGRMFMVLWSIEEVLE
jgi:hypothetical protein